MKGPLDVPSFIDRGRKDGVNLGDIFEVRSSKRYVEAPQGEAETLDEVMALVQVVHVGEQSSSVRIGETHSAQHPARRRSPSGRQASVRIGRSGDRKS